MSINYEVQIIVIIFILLRPVCKVPEFPVINVYVNSYFMHVPLFSSPEVRGSLIPDILPPKKNKKGVSFALPSLQTSLQSGPSLQVCVEKSKVYDVG